MNETVMNLVDAITQGDALQTEKAFQAAMAEKLSVKLDDMRAQVAQNMFNAEQAEEEPVVEEDVDFITMEEYEALSEEEKAEYDLVELEEDNIEEGVVDGVKKVGGAIASAAKGAVNAVGKTVGLAAKTAGSIRQTPAAIKGAYGKGREAADKSIAG